MDVDLWPAAVGRARKRLARFGNRARVIEDDVTSMASLNVESNDGALDIQCLHMLIVDADRQAYLQNAQRVLKPDVVLQFAMQPED